MSKAKRYKGNNKGNFRKKIFKLIVVILLLAICIVGIYFVVKNVDFSFIKGKQGQKEEQEENISISEKLLEDKEYNGMKIKEIELRHEKSASFFKCKIENNAEINYKPEDVYVIFLRNDGSELARFKYHLDEIPKGTEKNISITTTNRLIDADNFYVEKKE